MLRKSPAEGVQSTHRCATFRGEKFSVIVHNDENVIAIFSRQENATLFACGVGGRERLWSCSMCKNIKDYVTLRNVFLQEIPCT